MNDLEQEYIRAYGNYMGALDDVKTIRETYQYAAMVYFASLSEGIK